MWRRCNPFITRFSRARPEVVAQLDKAYLDTGWSRSLVRFVSYAFFEGRPVTTRGRWLNPLVFGLSSVLSRTGSHDTLQQPIFVVGTGRSGTTLLGRILSVHPEIGFLNEPKALWHRAITDEDIIGSYSEVPGRYCLTAADATPEVVERLRRLYCNYLRTVRRRRVVDKYPEAVYRAEFILSAMPDARIIWVLRDGADTVASIERWSTSHADARAGQSDNWWGRNDRKWLALVDQVCSREPSLVPHISELKSLTRDVDRAALEWSLNALQGQAIQDEYPNSVTQLRYEDLVDEPESCLRALAGFCGLAEDQSMLDFAIGQVAAMPARTAPELHPVVNELFQSTMRRMRYLH